jgi:hypothetical protein
LEAFDGLRDFFLEAVLDAGGSDDDQIFLYLFDEASQFDGILFGACAFFEFALLGFVSSIQILNVLAGGDDPFGEEEGSETFLGEGVNALVDLSLKFVFAGIF